MRLFARLLLLFAVAMAATSLYAMPQASDIGPESTWQGTLDLGANTLRIQFQFTRQEDGTYTGKLISVDQGNTVIDLDSVEIADHDLTIRCKKIGLTFSGKWDESWQKITGTLTQGADFPMELVKFAVPKDLKHIETWKGTMHAGPKEYDFQIRVFRDADNKLHGKLDSFSEHLGDLGIELDSKAEDTFAFTLPLTKASFEGKFNADRNRIDGKWRQSGGEFDLSFDKVDLAETRSVTPPKRPQNPKQPLPYRQQEIQFENAADKVTLSGTLTLPEAKGKYAAAILISGSGGQDRDESLLDHKPFLVLSDHLTRAGFAVLRYDDRGIGKSSGDHASADSRDFARDAGAAIDFLKQQDEIDARKIGLIGHSEGGLIAPIVATTRDDVAFIVMLAGTGVTGREIVLNQTELIEKADGTKPEISNFNREFLLAVLDAIESGKPEDEIKVALRARFNELRQKLPADLQSEITGAVFETAIVPTLSPWFRFFLSYDPRPALSKVRCPVLALNGSLDLQVDPKLNLPEIRTALASSGNRDVEVVELAGLNHLFQPAKTGSPSEYRAIETTMSTDALAAVSDWLTKRFK